ncbi:hypothetical protein JJE00_06420 [Candidatus Bathyarchaeota archaeon]|nr:hypothetical protein [Candidatus Bathyarchaeota archaeon]
MSLSPVKLEILDDLLLNDRLVKPIQVSKEIGKEFPSVMMHILGLTRMGYVTSPEKGHYTITQKGKNFFGLPEITRDLARTLLVGKLHDKAFHFYKDVGEPLNINAYNLQTFNKELKRIQVNSVDFHMKRGDFEVWFEGIGDPELAKKLALLKKKNFDGEVLRRSLQIMIVNRCIALAKIAGYTVVTK